MANTKTGNVWYVDTAYSAATDDNTDNIVVGSVVLTTTAASGRIILKDPKTGAIKLDLKHPTDADSKHFDFSANPIICPNGLRASTLTNAVATIILLRGGA
jgi:hypothetical protein